MQNRVDPFGEIFETKARGLWMGNRGNLHNKEGKIVRAFKSKAWITCKLEFNGRKRHIMTPGFYTELFFLDEATAFAAGHRPCFECRREDYNRFKSAWLKGNPRYKFTDKTSIQEIDDIIHRERINRNGLKNTHTENNTDLPDGSFITENNHTYLLFKRHLYLWTPSGYTQCKRFKAAGKSTVLTPASVLNAFRAGYTPQIDLTGI
ncbi:MAG TPA: hypothetical protein VHB70_19765 [Parafilimonas sp.]|nr:hypothetical protein [Parafilimonas sp.]